MMQTRRLRHRESQTYFGGVAQPFALYILPDALKQGTDALLHALEFVFIAFAVCVRLHGSVRNV